MNKPTDQPKPSCKVVGKTLQERSQQTVGELEALLGGHPFHEGRCRIVEHHLAVCYEEIERLKQAIREAGGDLLSGQADSAYETLKHVSG